MRMYIFRKLTSMTASLLKRIAELQRVNNIHTHKYGTRATWVVIKLICAQYAAGFLLGLTQKCLP